MLRFDDVSDKVSLLHRQEEEELIKTLSIKYGHQYTNLIGTVINIEAIRLIPETVARAAELAIFMRAGTKLSVAIRNPNNKATIDALAALKERNFTITIFMVSTASLEHAWERYHDIIKTSASEKGVLGITAEEIERMAGAIKSTADVAVAIEGVLKGNDRNNASLLLTIFLGGAISLKASDMHIEPEENDTHIRYRLDGVLINVATIDTHTCDLLRGRLKLLAGIKLNITDRAQDGRFTIDVGKKEYEIRASVIPGGYGESIVMRFLDPSNIDVTIADLGINNFLLSVIETELKRPNGMIITTGPTGSGKTTALYTFLRMVHNSEVKIITIEDPIEYHIAGIVQTQTTDEYSFASGLRAILRQDPDIIMVGEIRDRDVAETAINAALTGHLVFSTLHTNSAAGAFPRLRDLGIDTRTMGSAMNLVLAQRLVRKLCPHCKRERALTPTEESRFTRILVGYPMPIAVAGVHIFESVGCDKCSGSGFKGRTGIYEGIQITPVVAETIMNDLSEAEIIKAAQPQHIPNMQQDGVVKVIDGTTSIDELERVVDLYKEETPVTAQ